MWPVLIIVVSITFCALRPVTRCLRLRRSYAGKGTIVCDTAEICAPCRLRFVRNTLYNSSLSIFFERPCTKQLNTRLLGSKRTSLEMFIVSLEPRLQLLCVHVRSSRIFKASSSVALIFRIHYCRGRGVPIPNAAPKMAEYRIPQYQI